MLGWSNCFFTFYKDVSNNNNRVFTTTHSLYSFFTRIAYLSNGPVRTALINLAPSVNMSEYALGKYKYLVAYACGMPLICGFLILIRLLVHKASERRGTY